MVETIKSKNKNTVINRVQVLLVTMNMVDAGDLLNKVNIQSSFVIGNQCVLNNNEIVEWKGNRGLVISRNERGVGVNRNVTLEYSSGEICILADDDMTFFDGYCNNVVRIFDSIPQADVIIFNIEEDNPNQSVRRRNTRIAKVHLWNYMNYGAARIAFRRKPITYQGIFFNTMFGGGTPHSAGEDSLFLRECLRKKLKVYSVPVSIAKLNSIRDSSWFDGYTRNYFFDKGVFLAVAHPKAAIILAILFAFRYRNVSSVGTVIPTFKCIKAGIRYILKGGY